MTMIRVIGELTPQTSLPQLVAVARGKDRATTVRQGEAIHIHGHATSEDLRALLLALYEVEAAGAQDETEFVCHVDDMERVFDALHRLCGLREKAA